MTLVPVKVMGAGVVVMMYVEEVMFGLCCVDIVNKIILYFSFVFITN